VSFYLSTFHMNFYRINMCLSSEKLSSGRLSYKNEKRVETFLNRQCEVYLKNFVMCGSQAIVRICGFCMCFKKII